MVPFKDADRNREYQRLRVARRRAEFLIGKSCVGCGSAESLEFDHIDPSTKLSHRIWSWSADRIVAELAKCQVLCHSCHLAKSLAQMAETTGVIPYRHGSSSMYNLRGCRWGLCKLYKRNSRRVAA